MINNQIIIMNKQKAKDEFSKLQKFFYIYRTHQLFHKFKLVTKLICMKHVKNHGKNRGILVGFLLASFL